MKEVASVLAEIESLTKAGERSKALGEISRIVKKKAADPYRAQLARLSNRNHDYALAMQVLHKRLVAHREGLRRAEPTELVIYGASLLWMGAVEEASQYFQQASNHPEGLLHQAFLHFSKWEYEVSIPILKRYLASKKVGDYQLLVGKVNLLAAYVSSARTREAEILAEEIRRELETSGRSQILLGNCFELQSQVHLQKGEYKEALEKLNRAKACLADHPGRTLVYILKWEAVTAHLINPRSAEGLKKLKMVRAEAVKINNWESVRDCDFHLARLTNNPSLMSRVLLGTPFKGYRSTVQKIYGLNLPEDKILTYCPNQQLLNPQEVSFDLEELPGRKGLRPLSWSLLQALNKDIYQAPGMAVLFSKLYPGEYLDPFTSPQRVSNSVFRLNQWLSSQGVNLKVASRDKDYYFQCPEGFSISCQERRVPLPYWQAVLRSFRKANGGRSFSNQDLAQHLGVSTRASYVLLQQAMENKKIEKIGQGRSSRYIFYSGRRAAS